MNTERKTTVLVLPVETLSDIFILYRNTFTPPSLGWIIVTHVCQVWRAVCLAHAALWDTVNIRSPAAANAVLERARYTPPLYVHLPAPTKPDLYALSPPQSALVARLSDTRWRICCVDVIGKRDEVLAMLRTVARSSAHVRTLHIASYGHPSVPMLDSEKCESAFPELRTLVQRDHFLDLSSPAYARGLRSLTIDIVETRTWGEDATVTLQMVLNLLKRLPCLERLVLRYLCSLQDDVLLTDDEVISLNKLHYLEVQDTREHCALLLGRLTIPTDCEMLMDIGYGGDDLDLDPVLSAVDSIFHTTSMDSLMIYVQKTGYFEVTCMGIAKRELIIPVENSFEAQAYFSPVCMSILAHTSPLLVFILEIECNIHISPEVWQEVAPAITAPTVRIICEDINSGILPLLCIANSCPNMRNLIVDGLYFRRSRLEFENPNPNEEAEQTVLRALSGRGIPRAAVLMRNCKGVMEEDMERWKGCVWERVNVY